MSNTVISRFFQLTRFLQSIDSRTINLGIFVGNTIFSLLLLWISILLPQWLVWILMPFCVLSLHYHFNTVHQASHNMVSRSKLLNSFVGRFSSIFSGISFADFRSTHLEHHKYPTNKDKDPDHWITTSGSIITIPFKILWHDLWFWKKGLWKKSWIIYIIDRGIQIAMIVIIISTGYALTWSLIWLIPMLIVGLLNGLFLFYIPHYTHRFESMRGVLGTIFNFFARISRKSHELHHRNIAHNAVYYPVFWYVSSQLQGLQSIIDRLTKTNQNSIQ